MSELNSLQWALDELVAKFDVYDAVDPLNDDLDAIKDAQYGVIGMARQVAFHHRRRRRGDYPSSSPVPAPEA